MKMPSDFAGALPHAMAAIKSKVAVVDVYLASLHASSWTKRLRSTPPHDIKSSQSVEELSLCFRWVRDGNQEERFLGVLHINSYNAQAITSSITVPFIHCKNHMLQLASVQAANQVSVVKKV